MHLCKHIQWAFFFTAPEENFIGVFSCLEKNILFVSSTKILVCKDAVLDRSVLLVPIKGY